MRSDFTVTAHTGALGTPDNSLEAIEAGAKCGADIVEFDLRFDDAGQPVLSHDAPGGKTPVTLRQAFIALKSHDGLRANVDVKTTSNIAIVPALAAELGVLDRIFFTGIEQKDVAAVREKCSGIPYYLNLNYAQAIMDGQTDEMVIDAVAESGAVGINSYKALISAEFVRKVHARGLLVSVWTANEPDEMRDLYLAGCDNITTRRPDLMREIIENEKMGASRNVRE